jgi:sulfoxide reductase heme-binding subunit YedZ
MRWLRDHWLRLAVHVGAAAPLVVLAWSVARDRYFDAARQVTTLTGRVAIALVVLTLACTPVNIVSGWKRVMRIRRPLGLYAFGYALLHLLIFAGWDYGFQFGLLGSALFGQAFIVVGLLSLAVMLPLAITSTRGWQRRLGRGWKWLHRLVYLAASLAVVHFLLTRKDPTVPIRYAAVIGVLFLIRLPWVRRAFARLRSRARAGRREKPGTAAPASG